MSYVAGPLSRGLFLAITAIYLLGSTQALADWSHDPTLNTLLASRNNSAFVLEAVEDGSGGMIVAWETYNDGIFAQRFDSQGNRLWGSSDNLWLADENASDGFHLVGDDNGGAFLVWQSDASEAHIVKAQHFGSDGQPTWDTAGVPVGSLFFFGTTHRSPHAAYDGDGGLLVAWVNDYNGAVDIMVQRFAPDGTRLSSSTLASSGSFDKEAPFIVQGPEAGEAIVAWQELSDSGDWDIMGQYKNSSGENQWISESERTVIRTDGDQTTPRIALAANDRTICVCDDNSTGTMGLRFGQVTASGSYYGPISSPGRLWLGLFDVQENAQIVADNEGNVIVTCVDRAENGGGRIAAQFFPSLNDGFFWGDHGRTLHLEEYLSPAMTALTTGQDASFAVTWEQYDGASTFVAQQFDYMGQPIWCDSRGPFAQTDLMYDTEMKLLPAADGGFLACWSGQPSSQWGSSKRPYGQLIDAQGFMADNRFDVISVEDRPNDQGGELWVTWEANPLDNSTLRGIASYSLWIEELAKSGNQASADQIPVAELASLLKMQEADVTGLRSAGWTYAGSVPAVFSSEYSAFCPSFGDSTEAQIIWTGVKVIAHHEEPEAFWNSFALEGYSVDNLAPGAPLNLMGMDSAGQANLSWTASGHHDEDLAAYRVYRGAEPGFPLDPSTMVASATGTTFVDSPTGPVAYYRVTAVDVHGNESEASDEVAVQLAMSAANDRPSQFTHRGNWPNPFNPRTQVSFDLPSVSAVRVTVYDMSGRLVRTLVHETMAAGQHQVLWNGQDSGGRAVASGVYYSRVEAPGFSATRSMTLVR